MDFIGDFLTIIRNAARARKEKITLPASGLTIKIAEILKQEGYLENYKLIEEGKKRFLRIHLRYIQGRLSTIHGIVRVSKPGRRVYSGVELIPREKGGLGVVILSTSKGVMTDKEARRQNVGGEILCRVS